MKGPDESAAGRKAWQERYAGSDLRDADFTSLSGRPLEPLYTREDLAGLDLADDRRLPGRVPVHARRARLDVPREALDHAPVRRASARPRQTNERYRFLLEKGQTGLSVAFDNPTLYGLDSDHALSDGEVGKSGVAVDTLRTWSACSTRSRSSGSRPP